MTFGAVIHEELLLNFSFRVLGNGIVTQLCCFVGSGFLMFFLLFPPYRHLCGPNSEGVTSNWLVAGLAAALVATAGIVIFKFFRKGGSTT